MQYKDGKCVYVYCDAKCECHECSMCEHYRPNYNKEMLEDLKMEQQEQM